MQRDEGRALGRDDLVPERLEIPLQVGERRAQLVRGVRDEFASDPLLVADLGRHLVERVRERRDLVRTRTVDADAVVPDGHASRGSADLAQWSRDPPSERDGQHDACESRCDERSEEEARDGLVEHFARVAHGGAVLDHQLLERRRREDEYAEREDRRYREGHHQ